jgi:hypothetical protein
MELSQTDIDEIKARDSRFRAVDVAIKLQAELNAGCGLRLFMDALKDDAMQAMEAMCDVSPLDSNQIAQLQVRMRTYMVAEKQYESILLRGAIAEQDLRNSDLEEYDNGN